MNNQSTGTFIINYTFKINNRRLVLAGNIIDKNVSVGDLIEFTVSQSMRQKRILGVEGIRKSKPHSSITGLLIQCENDDEIIELNDWEPKNEVGKIIKAH